MDGVAFNELKCLNSSTFKTSQLCTDHVQHIAVSEEGAWKVETDGQRLLFRRFVKLNDRSGYQALADAEPLHSVDDWTDVQRTSAKQTHNLSKVKYSYICIAPLTHLWCYLRCITTRVIFLN